MKKSLLGLTVSAIFAGHVNAETTSVVYINGMNTSLESAILQRGELMEKLSETYPDAGYSDNVYLLPNTSEHLILDSLESLDQILSIIDSEGNPVKSLPFRQKIVDYQATDRDALADATLVKLAKEYSLSNDEHKASILAGLTQAHGDCYDSLGEFFSCGFSYLGNVSLNYFLSIVTPSEQEALETVDDKSGTLLAINDAISVVRTIMYRQSQQFTEVETMRDTLEASLDNDNNVTVAAYSQGNLYANTVLSMIDSPRINLVSIASPDDAVYRDGFHVTLQEDRLIAGLSRIASIVPPNTTNYQYSSEGIIGLIGQDTDEANPLNQTDANEHYFNDARGHSWRTHMDGDVSREQILNAIDFSYRSFGEQLVASADPTFGTAPQIGNIASPVQVSPVTEDIFLTRASLSESQVLPGDSLVGRVYQQHEGQLRTNQIGSVRVGYYLSEDEILGPDDVLLSEDTSKVGVNDRADYESDKLSLPDALVPGDYFILFVADHDNRVNETQEANNIIAVPLDVIGTGSEDAYLADTKIKLLDNDGIAMSARQMYEGPRHSRDVGNIRLGYYFSERSRFDSANAIRIASDYSTIGSNDAGDPERATVQLPQGLKNGTTYYIYFVADDGKVLDEVDEDNNIVRHSFTYEAPSNNGDVYMTDASVRKQSNGNYRLSVKQSYEGTVTNRHLPNPYLYYFLSDDRILSTNDSLISRDVSTIGNDDRYDLEYTSFAPPDNVSGRKYIIFYADARDRIEEDDETNNKIAVAIDIE